MSYSNTLHICTSCTVSEKVLVLMIQILHTCTCTIIHAVHTKYIPSAPRLCSQVSQMHPARVPDTSHRMCSGHIPHLTKKAWQSRTSCCSFIMRFCTCMDASRVHFSRISHASQTCPACKRYLGAKLYRIPVYVCPTAFSSKTLLLMIS